MFKVSSSEDTRPYRVGIGQYLAVWSSDVPHPDTDCAVAITGQIETIETRNESPLHDGIILERDPGNNPKKTMKKLLGTLLISMLILMAYASTAIGQPAKSKKILVDIAHGQRFWNDPTDMEGKDQALIERVRYMTGELQKNAASLNAEIGYVKSKLTPEALSDCDLLFIHIPSSKYSTDETAAIHKYVENGGALFLVAEVDYWATLEQVNANDIVEPFGIVYKGDNPDSESSGGHTKAGEVAARRYSIPYHGARMLEGGTPFCFSNKTDQHPFGVYKRVGNGGKIIAMGDGMASLYMTSWQDVHDYECSAFMHDVLGWLLK